MADNKIALRWVIIALVLCIVLVGLGIHRAMAAGEAPNVGTAAPDFTLPSQSGAQVSLHDFRGKWVVLYFYPKDMSHGCTIEAHNFQRDEAKYQQMNAVILGVSGDSVGSHQKFCAKDGLNFKLLADTDHAVSEEYGSLHDLGVAKLSARHTFLISPDGHIVKEFLDVNPSSHSQEVLAALAQLQKN